MDKTDEELTRRAIEEILREAKEQKERDEMPTYQERKINPLRKTNKQFLGRTLNAMVRHNERTDERNRKKCRKKLKELDKRHRERSKSSSEDTHLNSRKHRTKERQRSSEDAPKRSKKRQLKSKRKKKHKRRKKRHRDRSSSSSSSSCSSSKSRFNYRKHSDEPEQCWSNKAEEIAENRNGYQGRDFNVQSLAENYGSWILPPMLWTTPMQQLYEYQNLMSLAATQANSTETIQIEELSVSSSSLSDVNFDEVTEYKPSAKLIRTISLSTEDEEEPCIAVNEKRKKSSRESSALKNNSIEVCDSSSDISEKSAPIIEVTDSDANEVCPTTTEGITIDEVDSDAESEKSVISLNSVVSINAVDSIEE